jgi:hypothetical protein
LVLGELGSVDMLPARSAAAVLTARPALADHVERVVAARADPEVIRIAAGGVVARMTDTEVRGHGTMAQLVDDPMSSAGSAAGGDATITRPVTSPPPGPTFLLRTSRNLAPNLVDFHRSVTYRLLFHDVFLENLLVFNGFTAKNSQRKQSSVLRLSPRGRARSHRWAA